MILIVVVVMGVALANTVWFLSMVKKEGEKL